MSQFFFYVNQISNNRYSVKTQYTEYLIIVDELKGIGIYLDAEGYSLIKTFKHKKIETAINYLFKENNI